MKKICLILFALFEAISCARYEEIIELKKYNLKGGRGKIFRDPSQDYNYYLFAAQWASTYCINQGDSCYDKLAPIPKHHVTIHGLWPSIKNGAKMSECNTGSTVSVDDDGSEVYLNMRKYWPSLVKDNKSFWEHEYNKHGFCYNKRNGLDTLEPKFYFEKAVSILLEKKINTLIIELFDDKSGSYSINFGDFRKKIESKLGGKYFVGTCKGINGKKYLSEMRFTLGMNFEFISDVSLSGGCSDKSTIIIDYW